MLSNLAVALRKLDSGVEAGVEMRHFLKVSSTFKKMKKQGMEVDWTAVKF